MIVFLFFCIFFENLDTNKKILLPLCLFLLHITFNREYLLK